MNGRRLITNIDRSLGAFADKSSFPWFLSLSIALKEVDTDGLPTKREGEALNSWEDQVEAAIASATKFKYVGRVYLEYKPGMAIESYSINSNNRNRQSLRYNG